MDIKLKSLNKRQMEILLTILWMSVFMAITFAVIFQNYLEFDYYWSGRAMQFYRISSIVLMILSLIIGAEAIRMTLRYQKNYKPLENLTVCRLDHIKTELLIVLLIFGGGMWMDILTSQDVYLLGNFMFSSIVVDGIGELNQMILLLFLFITCFCGSILVLIRQKRLGIMPDTSFLWKEVRKYKTRTPLEIQIQTKRKIPMIIVGILTAVSVLMILPALDYGYIFGGIQALLAVIVLVICLKSWLSDKTTREIGSLLRQIEIMSEGEELSEEIDIPEKSLLYPAFGQLKNIDAAMRKSVEKQVQAERLKIDLITNVSHDLKTPLTSMVGYTDLLKKEDLSAEARDYVDVISVKQEQLKNMIQDLFELSKATSGVEQLVLETLDMRRLVEQTMGDMEDAIRESGMEIRTRFSQDSLLFTGDNGKMYRVMQNLLENALKYSLAGTRIYIDVEKKASQVELQIKNIAAYEMDFSPDEIIERFVRGDKSRTTEGHGLGLAIASGFVRNMGGTLEVFVDGDLFKVQVRLPSVTAETK